MIIIRNNNNNNNNNKNKNQPTHIIFLHQTMY